MDALRLSLLLNVAVNLPDPVASLFTYGVDGDFPGRVLYPSLPPERESVYLSYFRINGGQVEQEINSKPDGVPGCFKIIGDIGGELRRITDVLRPEIGLLPF